MKLPNHERAYIPEAKLFDYLLSPTHLEGSPKAALFEIMGYNRMNAESLKKQFLRLAAEEDITDEIVSQYGTKYIIDGEIERKKGNGIPIRTVWIINKGEQEPQFVTAYPL